MEPFDTIIVSEAMNRDFGRVEGETPVEKVVELMLQNHWGEVVVTSPGTPDVQLITKEHLMRSVDNGFPAYLPIREIAIRDIVTTTRDESLIIARDVMRQHKIGRLPVVDPSGIIIGILTARDVCNGFSNKLELLGEHMYSILNNINEAIHVVNCEGQVVFWNHRAESLFGITAQEVMGKNLAEYMPNDITLDVIQSLNPYHDLMYELRDNVYVVSNAVPVKMPAGDIVGAVCTTVDVSKSKMLIEQLEQANTRVKNLQQHLSTGCGEDKELFYTINEETRKVANQARRVASTDATVLIQGESGTGKELMANVIYRNSKRPNAPFIAVNCSAIPSTLFESEMFGYEAGSFTGGSKSGKQGKFEMANGGTIFLDEIGELPLDMQAKLLRVIQERKFYRVGGTKPIEVDVRLIAATNRELAQQVKENKFREDLYYRLNVVTLEIPPLRSRQEDLPGLTSRFIKEMECLYQRSIEGIDPSVMELFQAYDWPGNVRQLHNLLERVVILTEDNQITLKSLEEAGVMDLLATEDHLGDSKQVSPGQNLDDLILDHQKEVIINALKKCQYNKAETSKLLGIPRSTLYYKLKLLNIDSPQKNQNKQDKTINSQLT